MSAETDKQKFMNKKLKYLGIFDFPDIFVYYVHRRKEKSAVLAVSAWRPAQRCDRSAHK